MKDIKYPRDYNTNVNQDIKRKFVNREVIYNVSYLISELVKWPTINESEELYGLYQTPDYERSLEEHYWISKEELLDQYNIDPSLLKEHCEEELLEDIDDIEYFHLDEFVDDINIDNISLIDDCTTEDDPEEICFDKDIDIIYNEVYEHWIVTGWLGEKLRARGETVKEIFGLTVWGRGTTGQAILLDYVISTICDELEILDGQDSAWNKKYYKDYHIYYEDLVIPDILKSSFNEDMLSIPVAISEKNLTYPKHDYVMVTIKDCYYDKFKELFFKHKGNKTKEKE